MNEYLINEIIEAHKIFLTIMSRTPLDPCGAYDDLFRDDYDPDADYTPNGGCYE